MRPIISKIFRTAVFMAAIAGTGITAASQQKGGKAGFVDGFHGGVYGHYPLKTYTGYMADQLDIHPDWSICLEIEPETWDSVMVAAPADYLRLREYVKNGRAEFTNPTYAQPYMYNISGESIIRQFEYGIRKTREYFPEAEFLTYAVEEPCFTSCLPQILKGFGFKYASLKCPNTCWGGYYAPVEGELVNWTGPDGSVILCSPRYSFEELSRQNVFSTNANNNCEEYLGAAAAAGFRHPVGMTYQDAGWTFGPWLESQWKDFGDVKPVSSAYTTWRNYFESVEGEVNPVEYISNQEDVRPALMWGSQVMQRIGRDVRSAENRIVLAEKMGVMANIDKGYAYNEAAMDEGWRTLLLSQHHDSWIVPYNGLKKKGTWADWICGEWTGTTLKEADRTIAEARFYLGGGRADKGDYRIRVYNTAGSAESKVVSVNLPADWGASGAVLKDADGNVVESCVDFVNGVRKILFRADAPSFGYSTYSLERSGAAPVVSGKNSANVIENDMYRIVVDPKKGGVIKSIICKNDRNRELVRNGEYSFGELKGYFYDEERFISSAASKAVVTVVENNEFEKSLRICGMIGVHPFIETITIRQGDPKIDFSLRIEWQDNPGIGAYRQTDAFGSPERSMYDDRYHLNMYFPSTIDSPEIFKGAPFDVCRSGLDDTNFHNWHDIKHNILLDWVSAEGRDCGMALFSDHTTSYVHGGGRPLALTVQASGNGLWGRDYRIDGSTVMDFAIVPHTGGWKTASEEYARWNEPVTASLVKAADLENRSFIDTGGYDITAARLDGTDVLVRLFNSRQGSEKHRIKVDGRFNEAVEVDLSGKETARHSLTDGAFEVSIPQFGLKTFILKKRRDNYTGYVDTRIGTDSDFGLSHGNTYPATGMPFGQHLWSPRTGDRYDGWKYNWAHSEIRGFEQSHQCSPWMGEYGVINFMPETGRLVTKLTDRGASFSHDNESASPEYYRVTFDNGITTEISATERCGFLHFTYPAGGKSYLVIDGFNDLSDIMIDKKNRRVAGWVSNGHHFGSVKERFRCWFIAQFDSDFEEFGIWENVGDTRKPMETRGSGKGTGAYLRFADGASVNVKVTSSYISPEQAEVTLGAELGGMENAGQVRDYVRRVWDSLLGRIDVSGASLEEIRTFYSCLFRSNLFSRKFYEVKADGTPHYFSPYDGEIHDGYMFTDNGFWDTFRSQFPLTVILHPQMHGRYMNALLDAYDQMGWLPQWSQPGETGGMVGNHAISLLADAWAKGVRTFDPEKALDAYYHEATEKGPWGGANGRGGYKDYWELGYVSHNGTGDGATAMTLEYAYDDFCAYQIAKSIGNEKYMEIFGKSLLNYRNVFDPSTGFMRGKDRKGRWVEPFDPTAWGGAYVEGDAWHYSWSVFQDTQGLIDLFGSDEAFVSKLDSVFTVPPVMNRGTYWEIIHEMVEMELAGMGQYAHGNQPIQHMPYLYSYAGQPWKTQYWTREIMRRLYNSGPQGYPGDEDQGGMSSWYVLSALGLYAVTPGTDQYVIGSPVFRKAVLSLDNGRTFTVRAENNSHGNVYVRAAWLNGKPLDKNYIRYSDIMAGGELHLIMGSVPDKTRNTGKDAAPYSFSSSEK